MKLQETEAVRPKKTAAVRRSGMTDLRPEEKAPEGLCYEKLDGDMQQRTRALWEEVFAEDTGRFLDYYYREKAPRSQIHALFEGNGRAVAMVQLNPYAVLYHGEKRQSYYIVGVATAREYRRRGCMAFLLRRALAQARAEGCPFVFLMPADPAIYEPFGFRYGCRLVSFERTEELKRLMDGRLPGASGNGERPVLPGASGNGEQPVLPGTSGNGEQPACPGKPGNGEQLVLPGASGNGERPVLSGASENGERLVLSVYSGDRDGAALEAYAARTLSERYHTYCIHDRAYFDRLGKELRSENGNLYLIRERRDAAGGTAGKAAEDAAEDGRLCGYFGYACEGGEFLQEAVFDECAGALFRAGKEEERIMLLALADGVSCGRAYFPEIV